MEKTAMLQRLMLFTLATAVLCGQNESRPAIRKTPAGRTSASSGQEMYRVYCAACHGTDGKGRSEEHTSELQSLRHLVCRLLLEKKHQCTSPCAARRTSPPGGATPAPVTAR